MCFGVRKRKRTQADVDDDEEDAEKTKQTLPLPPSTQAGAFNEHQSWRLGPSSTRPQMGYGTQQLDRQAGQPPLIT